MHLAYAACWDVKGGQGGKAGKHGRPGAGGRGGRGGRSYSWYEAFQILTHPDLETDKIGLGKNRRAGDGNVWTMIPATLSPLVAISGLSFKADET